MKQNVKFLYLYRDAGNNKQYNEVVFSNESGMSIDHLRTTIENNLIEGQWFVAKDLGLQDMFFKEYGWDPDLDHNWHEFEDVEMTEEATTSEEDIADFLATLSSQKYDNVFD